MIRFDRVSKRYGSRDVLAQLSFEVADGEMVFITGHSGCGKSTVVRLIALLERAAQGQIWVNGEHLNTLRARAIPPFRRGIGLLLQPPRLLHERSVFDNLALPLLIADLPSKARRLRIGAALEQAGMPAQGLARVSELSAGEQARVALARAIVAQPPLLLADEPTASLDAAQTAAVMALLRQLNGSGMTIVVATHHVHLVRDTGRREIALDRADTAAGELASLPVIAAVR